MRILAGGFGIQGLLVIPLIDVLDRKGVDYELVVNGLGGFYAVLKEKLGREQALERIKEFIRRFWEDLSAEDRTGLCESGRKRWYKSLAVRWCYLWATRESRRSWEDLKDLLEGVKGESEIGVEYIDISNLEIGVYRGDAGYAAMLSVAFLGIFPPLDGRYFSTSYLSQIPVLSAEDGDLVLVNLRDPSKCDVRKADEILAQSAELRAIALARKYLSRKDLKILEMPPIGWKDIGDLKRFEESIGAKLEGLI